jgi:hypothetical protein
MSTVNDPITGEPNVVEPSARWKTDGWNRTEVPPRQFMNWQGRTFSEWIAYLDERARDTMDSRRVFVAGAGLPSIPAGSYYWDFDPDHPEYGWTCVNAAGVVLIPIQLRSRDVVASFGIKYYNSHPTDGAIPQVSLYHVNAMATTAYAADAPTLTAGYDFSSGTEIAAASWGVRSVTVGVTLGSNNFVVAMVRGGRATDRIGSLWVDVSTAMGA